MFPTLRNTTRRDVMGHAWTVFRNVRRTNDRFTFAEALHQSWVEHRAIARRLHAERSEQAAVLDAIETRIACLNGKARWHDSDYAAAARLQAERAALLASL